MSPLRRGARPVLWGVAAPDHPTSPCPSRYSSRTNAPSWSSWSAHSLRWCPHAFNRPPDGRLTTNRARVWLQPFPSHVNDRRCSASASGSIRHPLIQAGILGAGYLITQGCAGYGKLTTHLTPCGRAVSVVTRSAYDSSCRAVADNVATHPRPTPRTLI